MNTLNVISRKESESGLKSQIQMKLWRKKNSSQLNEFQSLYGSLNGSIVEDVSQKQYQQFSHNTNSGSNPNDSSHSKSINRNSSVDSFYSCQSIAQNDVGVKSMSDRDFQDCTDEEFKSIKDKNSEHRLSQINPQTSNNAFQYQQKNTIDEERDSRSSQTNYTFYTPKNKFSDIIIDENNLKMSQEIFQKQVQQINNGNSQQKEAQQNNQKYNQKNGQIWLSNKKSNILPSINNRKNDTSSSDDQFFGSGILNQNQVQHIVQKNSKEEQQSSIGQPLIEGGVKKYRNSVTFTDNNEIMDQFQNSQYQPPQLQNTQQQMNGTHTKNKNQKGLQNEQKMQENRNSANRGKSLSTLKKMIDSQDGQQQQQNNEKNTQNSILQNLNNSTQFNNSSLILNQQQSQGIATASMNQGRVSTNFKQSLNGSQQSPSNQKQYQKQTSGHIKKISHTMQQSPSSYYNDEQYMRKISQMNKQQRKHTKQPSIQINQSSEIQAEDQNRKKSTSIQKNDDNNQNKNYGYNDKYLQEFLYFEKKKKRLIIAHNNRLIDRRKYDIRKKPESDNEQRFTLNLTLLFNIILEKQPNMKYLLFLNHFIGAISRGFIYFFLILISIYHKNYFTIFGPTILLNRLYYIISMYYVLFYPEQKSVSFRKISKIFNNVFYLPSEYKKPVMSEMIDVMNKNQLDKEEKMMKRKFAFCPVEINYLSMMSSYSTKKWNLFYISNFIYQGIESICLYPVVIAFTIHFHSEETMIIGIDFLIFARYIIVGVLSIFFCFCFFVLFYGNKKLKKQ